jgi:hypothetical protein
MRCGDAAWQPAHLRDPTSHSWVLGMEAFETIASYSLEAADTIAHELQRAGGRLIAERVRIGYEAFFDLVPREHLEFLKGLTTYHCTPDVVCVHGGILDDRAVSLRNPETLIWGPEGCPDAYCGQQPVAYGHWDNSTIDETGWPWPRIKANGTFGLDTISRGVLTAMSFPDGQVIQSGGGSMGMRYVRGPRESAGRRRGPEGRRPRLRCEPM